MIAVVVEGDTDVPYVKKLCAHARAEIVEPFVVRRGKAGIDEDLSRYGNAAKTAPYLVVRDLDDDAACAPEWLEVHAPARAGSWLMVRLAVRSVESWFLADAGAAARCLRVDVSNVPVDPDAVADPKGAIVALARKSTKKSIRERVAPGQKDRRRVGPQYEQMLIEWTEKWRVEVAMGQSASLRRAHAALVRVWAEYTEYIHGGR